jgi:transketolase
VKTSKALTDELCINTIRFLAVDAIEKAKSGHPGTPMGAAPVVYTLWDRILKHNPSDPSWPDRDRFVLSPGHASMLLYSLLHLTGYNLPLDELKNFRQWGSKTPGHPEYGLTPGVETTTGPLGQGFANAVGMAIAERWLAGNYNKPGIEIVNHHTYALVSDGDLQEGISSEAASLAGTLHLNKLIFLYDDNDISIEGDTCVACSEDTVLRFRAYGWHVVGPIDGSDISAVSRAIRACQRETERPNLIICRTVIGFGSPNKAGTASAHGEPLGASETALAKQNLGWTYPEPFTVPPEVYAHMRKALDRGKKAQSDWHQRLDAYKRDFPSEAAQFLQDLGGDLPPGWDAGLDNLFIDQAKPISTREASGKAMNLIGQKVNSFMGGSADLAPSTKTLLKDLGDFSFASYSGRNMHFGIREHAMGAVSNGMALHGGLIPYTATFLVFYDYMRPPVRLASFMGIRVIFIYTHDSIAVGEDGPTHEPIEQLIGLRSVPKLVTIRPADATETVEAWKLAMQRKDGPTALVLTRQNVPVLDRKALAPATGVQKGGYIIKEPANQPQLLLISTGSEVQIALDAAKKLEDKCIAARVVSLPSWEVFEKQSDEYKESILPQEIRARVSIEASTPLGWQKYVGLDGICIGIPRFGASAPGEVVYEKLGLTSDHVVEEAEKLLRRIGK